MSLLKSMEKFSDPIFDLKNDVLHALEVLEENDRDLKSILIFCNPNHNKGRDRDLKPRILNFLLEMVKQDKISKKWKKLGNKKYLLYSLIKEDKG